MRKVLSIICLGLAMSLYAIEPIVTISLPVYEDNGLTGDTTIGSFGEIYNITQPQIQLYIPEGATPCPVLLTMPGGAYKYVSNANEGIQVAEHFTQQGFAVAVLHYRLPNAHSYVPLQDAQMAMLWLRQHGAAYGIDTTRIGAMGFSAGGHLAGSILTLWHAQTLAVQSVKLDDVRLLRPDFGVLIYPVLSMGNDTHGTTCRLLLGENADPQTKDYWTLLNQVREDTPPTIIIACQDDKAVPISNSLNFYQAMTDKKVAGELLIYPQGGHGWGYARPFPQREYMEATLLDWLKKVTGKTE